MVTPEEYQAYLVNQAKGAVGEKLLSGEPLTDIERKMILDWIGEEGVVEIPNGTPKVRTKRKIDKNAYIPKEDEFIWIDKMGTEYIIRRIPGFPWHFICDDEALTCVTFLRSSRGSIFPHREDMRANPNVVVQFAPKPDVHAVQYSKRELHRLAYPEKYPSTDDEQESE